MEIFKRKPSAKDILLHVNNFNFNRNNFFDKEAYLAALKLTNSFRGNDNNFQNIIIKVNFINEAFKTAILDTQGISKFIYKIKNIDARLENGDIKLVKEISTCYKTNKTQKGFRDNYSFATKYCHCHNPKLFPIYDRYVAFALHEYNKQHKFSNFKKKDLLDYSLFKNAINDFKNKFVCTDIDNSQLDRFLWTIGRDILQKNKI
ncbi:MAG: hypothetical protein U0U67_04640 [Chitinophagales bacterium]